MREHHEVPSSDAVVGHRRDESGLEVVGDGRADAPSGSGVAALLAAIACTVFGSRLIVIAAFGSPVPLLDQWDGEGALLYSPYLKGTLSFAGLFASHNGHRILVTRLLALGHLELAGEWNTRLEMIVGAVVLTAVVTWLAALLMPLVARDRQLLLSCFIAVVFAFPIDYENAVWGFQSQVYLSLLFGLAAVAAFASAAPFSPRWFAGLAAGVLAYFTFATGVAALLSAGLIVSLQLVTNVRKRCAREVIAVMTMALIAVGLTLWGAGSATTMSNLWTFLGGLGIFATLTFGAIVPIVLYCRRTLARRPCLGDRAWVMLGVTTWLAIQLALFAIGRGIHVAPRYMDVVLLAYLVALVAVLDLSDHASSKVAGGKVSFRARTWVIPVIVVMTVAGCASVLACKFWSRAAGQQLTDVRAYLATGDVEHLTELGGPTHGIVLRHPYPERQARALDDPAVRAILPREIRPGDADNNRARKGMLLRGKLAAATATAVQLIFLLGPGVLALGLAILLVVGRARRLRTEDCPQQLHRDRVSFPLIEDGE